MPKVPFRDNEDVAVIHEPNYHFIGILLVDYNAIVLVVDAPFEDGRISHVVDSVGIKQRVLRQPAASLHQFALHFFMDIRSNWPINLPNECANVTNRCSFVSTFWCEF